MKLEIIDYGLDKNLYPIRKYHSDAGMDVYLQEEVMLPANSTITIGVKFGLHIPKGYMIQFIERSSIAKGGIIIGKSPVDAGYTGEMHLFIHNINNEPIRAEKGSRIAQMVLVSVIYFDIIESEREVRENKGLGSSGK